MRAGAGRIHKGCTVYKVVPVSDDLARVYYLQNGESFGVEAKRVVVSTPYFVTAAGAVLDQLQGVGVLLLHHRQPSGDTVCRGRPRRGAHPLDHHHQT